MLRHIPQIILRPAEYFPYSADMHIISNIFPANSSLTFNEEKIPSKGKWAYVQVDSCEIFIFINYHPKIRPILGRETVEHLNSHQDVSLVINGTRLRFISFHKQ